MKKVLITGIDGFTGVYLESLLKRADYDVYGTVFPKSAHDKHLYCDISDKQDILSALSAVKPDYVIHLAGISFVPHSDFKQIYDVNLIGTIHLMEALLELNMSPRKVILAGTANVYGNPSVKVIDEDVCPAPLSHYAASKLAMEYMARNLFDQLNILITRPFNYTGSGQGGHFLVPKIVNHYREGAKKIELGNLEVVRDFTDVRFVAEVYMMLMECDAMSEIVNICSGTGVALMDIIRTMNKLAGYEMQIQTNPAFIRKNEVSSLVGSNRKLSSFTGGLKPHPLEDTLKWMFSAA
jgi:nucleoside-diphosphate-sugar epimerase